MIQREPPPDTATGFVWWKHGVIYQVYPRSFQDTNGDGVGDLEGIISRLDYLAELGVDAIWLSPIYRSPMDDFGYDVTDHLAIDPVFGNIDMFHRLVREVHNRGLKLILDYIPNHTSDRHPWFQESRSSKENLRRDWYIWRDAGLRGAPPNNWRSEFGGPAWTWDATRRQYYYHAFLSSQPDLNWRHPDVVQAMLDIVGFWLDHGVDGFRVDAIHHLIEAADLADNPLNPDWQEGMSPSKQLLPTHTIDQPEVHDAIAALRRFVDRYGHDLVLIGEAYLPIDPLMAYYGEALDGFHLPFNFHLITTPWTPTAIATLVEAYEAKLPPGAWPNWVLGNHDRARVASRVGLDQARTAAMLLLTLRGTPTIYQGDELGMTDVPIPPDRVRDPWEINIPGLGLGRDPARTPMLWNSQINAGFSAAEPWLPLSSNWREINLECQRAETTSIWTLYRDLLAIRRREPALSAGDYVTFAATASLLAYERRLGVDRCLIVLDLSGQGGRIEIPAGRVLLSTDGVWTDRAVGGELTLTPNQGVVVKIA
jgi:alpha-glucosidase